MTFGRAICIGAILACVVIVPATAMAQDDKGPVRALSTYFTPFAAFDNFNTGGVMNGPTSPTTFTLAQSAVIVQIQTYHWNNGAGATLGTIKLTDATGKVYGPWPATGVAGQGGKFWVVSPNVAVPAGTYTVVDSDNATWSHNGESKNKGFAKVSAKK